MFTTQEETEQSSENQQSLKFGVWCCWKCSASSLSVAHVEAVMRFLCLLLDSFREIAGDPSGSRCVTEMNGDQ